MNKDLFDIYDVVVFEDENGITQDCVCSIGKDKEVENEIDIIVCNNNIISIYYDGNYKVWERDGKELPYYSTNKKIIHLYTLKDNNRFYEVYPTNNYESIDNAESNKALERIKKAHYTAIAVMGCERDIETENAIAIIEKEIQRLQAIDNLEISDALEIVDSHLAALKKEKYNTTYLRQDFDTIKQALLKAQGILLGANIDEYQ